MIPRLEGVYGTDHSLNAFLPAHFPISNALVDGMKEFVQ